MMASAKKGKKSKGVTLSFQEFTARIDGDSSSGQNIVYAAKKPATSSWADEVEEDELITAKERIVLPSAPRASRGPAYDDSEIPRHPPFQVNLGNLNYDIDEEDIYKFFRDLDILELKLPRDHTTNRVKGFGFVVFQTRADLIEALIRNEQMLRGRPIRIALLNENNPRRTEGGYERRSGGQRTERPPPEDEGVDNWRTVMRPDQPLPGQQPNYENTYGGYGGNRNSNRRYDSEEQEPRRGGGGGGRRYDDSSSRYNNDERNSDSEESAWRNNRVQAPQRAPNGNYNNRNRSPAPEEDFVRPVTVPREQIHQQQQQIADQEPRRGGGGGGRRYDDSSSRYNNDERNSDSEESAWRNNRVQPPQRAPNSNYRNRSPAPEENFVRPVTVPREQIHHQQQQQQQQQQPIAEPKQRKKLVLQPRTVETKEEPASASNYASIFGEAKPVDTFKRELEIEEKIEKLSIVVKPEETTTTKYRLLTRESSSQEKFVDITPVEKVQRPKRQLSWRQQQPYREEENFQSRQPRQHRRGNNYPIRTIRFEQSQDEAPLPPQANKFAALKETAGSDDE